MTQAQLVATRVLLVDDDLDRRTALHAFLETAGYSVRAVGVEDAALSLCDELRPSLVVLGGSAEPGVADRLRRRLLERPGASSAAFIACQALDGGAARRADSTGWADDLLSWPVSRSELLWRVRAVLRWKAASADRTQLLRAQLDEVLELQRTREQTLALLIHDMKNPLAGVVSNVEFLRGALGATPAMDPELPSCMQDITQASKRLYRMVQSLLDVSQSDDGLLALDVESIDVRALVEDVHESCRARLRDKDITLRVSCPDSPLTLEGDRELLVRLLANLLDNAISATPGAGTIELQVQPLPAALEISVHDQGPGMPAAERSRLKEPAAREHQKARARRGFGLQACRVLAEAHGGAITVQDRLPRGATVRLRLPRPA